MLWYMLQCLQPKSCWIWNYIAILIPQIHKVFLCNTIFNSSVSLCISAVKQYLCVTLSKNGVSNVNEATGHNAEQSFPRFSQWHIAEFNVEKFILIGIRLYLNIDFSTSKRRSSLLYFHIWIILLVTFNKDYLYSVRYVKEIFSNFHSILST